MSLLVFTLLMLLLGFVAGVFGSILGLGGGIIITPIITTFFGVDIKYAIGASIVAVIATSSGAAISYLKDDMINVRTAMFLEIFTTIGGLVGAILAGFFDATILNILTHISCMVQICSQSAERHDQRGHPSHECH